MCWELFPRLSLVSLIKKIKSMHMKLDVDFGHVSIIYMSIAI